MTCWIEVSINLENGSDFNRFLSGFKVFKYASEDIGTAFIWFYVNTIRAVFEVGNNAVTINEAHKTNLANYL